MNRLIGAATALVCCTSLIATAGCGPSEKDVKAFNAAYDNIEPTINVLAKMYDAIPAKGSEKEMLCAGAVPKEGLESIGWDQLEDVLEKNEQGSMSRWKRLRFTSGPFDSVYPRRTVDYILENDPAPAGGIMNLERAAEELREVKRVVVFRSTAIDKGEIGGRKGTDYSIKRNAKWEGWAFVFTLADPPVLEAAFPTWATNGTSIYFTKKKGKRPAGDILIGDAIGHVRGKVMARLQQPGCPRKLGRNEKWQVACAATPSNAMACFELARLYKSGVDYKKDEAKALALFSKACAPDKYVPKACSEAGWAAANGKMSATKDAAKAGPLYKKACDGGVMVACNNLGVLTGKGEGVAKDVPGAVALYRKACDGKNGLGCANLARFYQRGSGGVEKNEVKAIGLRHNACMYGHKKSCHKRR